MKVWLYDGEPDHLDLSVRNAQHDEGGYAKYVPIWRANARIDGAKIVRVIVFGLHPRYEKIKRMLVQCLAGSGQQNACQSVDEILEKAKYLFSISPATNAQLDQALKEMA